MHYYEIPTNATVRVNRYQNESNIDLCQAPLSANQRYYNRGFVLKSSIYGIRLQLKLNQGPEFVNYHNYYSSDGDEIMLTEINFNNNAIYLSRQDYCNKELSQNLFLEQEDVYVLSRIYISTRIPLKVLNIVKNASNAGNFLYFYYSMCNKCVVRGSIRLTYIA